LDTYLLGKAGFNVWLWDNSSPKSSRHYSTGYGHVLGIDACIRYFFSEKFGIFAETGYERYYGYFSAEYNWAYPTPAVWSDYIDIVALYEKFFFCRLYS
jgi:hypothetical protein